MKVIEPGHTYELDNFDGAGKQILKFVNRNEGQECQGTVNQEVLRALIDRIKFLDDQMHWELNQQIIKHLRMVIALHEARALIRKVEKDKLDIEKVKTGLDGHLAIHDNDYWENLND